MKTLSSTHYLWKVNKLFNFYSGIYAYIIFKTFSLLLWKHLVINFIVF